MKRSIQIALTVFAIASIAAIHAESAVPAAVKAKQPTAHAARRPENLSGKITMVDPARKLVVVQDSSGVPFDMVVNRSTHIESAKGTLHLEDLNSDLDHNASIEFVPERRGDVARTIRILQ